MGTRRKARVPATWPLREPWEVLVPNGKERSKGKAGMEPKRNWDRTERNMNRTEWDLNRTLHRCSDGHMHGSPASPPPRFVPNGQDLEVLSYLFYCGPNSLAKAVEFGHPPLTSGQAKLRTH
eukprot:gene23784-biopygen4360